MFASVCVWISLSFALWCSQAFRILWRRIVRKERVWWPIESRSDLNSGTLRSILLLVKRIYQLRFDLLGIFRFQNTNLTIICRTPTSHNVKINYRKEKAGKTKKRMSPNVQTQIIAMIENCNLVEGHQLNSDSIYDFVAERTYGKKIKRFADVDSIQKWLYDENGNRSGKKAATKPGTKPRPSILKVGQIIKIQRRKDDPMFSDFERAKVVLLQKNTSPSRSDDSAEIDVTTVDIHPPLWNAYGTMAPQEYHVSTKTAQQQQQQQLQHQRRRSIVKQPKANETQKRKRSQSSNGIKKEPRFWCKNCEKKYQQNSSLLRHQRAVHEAKRPKLSESPLTEL